MVEVLVVSTHEPTELELRQMEDRLSREHEEDVSIKFIDPLHEMPPVAQFEKLQSILVDETSAKEQQKKERLKKFPRIASLMGVLAANGVSSGGFCYEKTTEQKVRHNPTFYAGREVGRNQPCPCGSGVKYKKCCRRKQEKESSENGRHLPSGA